MKQHFCSAENSLIEFEKECNWCGEKEWVGLTDREMMDAIQMDDSPMEMGRKIEAKLKEKNT
jgi:hypothetical protein